ncbi:MAG: hypothetical protein AAF065_04455 [Verrucomicrobiota bacterium]
MEVRILPTRQRAWPPSKGLQNRPRRERATRESQAQPPHHAGGCASSFTTCEDADTGYLKPQAYEVKNRPIDLHRMSTGSPQTHFETPQARNSLSIIPWSEAVADRLIRTLCGHNFHKG